MRNAKSKIMAACLLFNAAVMVFVACATPDRSSDQFVADKIEPEAKEFGPYIKNFIDYGKKYDKDYSEEVSQIQFYFADIKAKRGEEQATNAASREVVGYCDPEEKPKAIVIDRSYWKTASNTGKEILIFHELGHCALDRDHNVKRVKDKPISLMYPILTDEDSYTQNKTDYLRELFLWVR